MTEQRVEVVVKKTRIGKIPTIRDTEAPSGIRATTDTERVLLTEHKEKTEEILGSVDTEAAESGEVVGHIALRDGSVEWVPSSGKGGKTGTGMDRGEE